MQLICYTIDVIGHTRQFTGHDMATPNATVITFT